MCSRFHLVVVDWQRVNFVNLFFFFTFFWVLASTDEGIFILFILREELAHGLTPILPTR